jgi:hypothetical protein
MSVRRGIGFAACLGWAAALACDGGGAGPSPVPAALLKVDGDGQVARIGAALARPLRVRVVDASGAGLDGVPVAFAVVVGSGSVAPAVDTSRGGGFAETAVTLGPERGALQIVAWVPDVGVPPVLFGATAVQTASEAELEFVLHAETAPELETRDTAFWAFAGRDTTVEIRYRDRGKAYLRFRLDDQSLWKRPDGTLFAPGDSVQIRIRIEDAPDPALRFWATLEPAGLRFHPDAPAELEYRYEFADDAFLARETEFGVWLQEAPGEEWIWVPSAQFEDADEIEVELPGFTRYALAIG